MRHLSCPNCGRRVYFENFACLNCGAQLAFSPDDGEMKPTDGEGGATACANRAQFVCNWATTDGAALCRSCRLNSVIPNLAFVGNLDRWKRIEQAKRRVVFDLERLGLPIVSRAQDAATGLAFQFLSDALTLSPVMTGHDSGLITLDIAEADDAARESRRTAMGEPYRTLVGHFRHELAHYYWDLLVKDSEDLNACRFMFGDERADYEQALKAHYENGPPADWQARFISAYASSHPWEDWAETFAHFIHIVATMDTALDFGIGGSPARPIDDPYREEDFDALIAGFLPVTEAVNEINRSIGQPDVYPFVLTPEVIGKLHFVHIIACKAAAGARKEPAAA